MRALYGIGLAILMVLPAIADDAKSKAVKTEVDEKKPISYWMEKKLEYSQEILRGLAIGDTKLVATKAHQLRVLSKVEGWIRKGKPGYKEQLQAFDFANAEIKRHADADNIEGAAMGFQQLTISCVSCHAMIRNPN